MNYNTYWNNNGRFQKEYDELKRVGFKWTIAEENAKYRYFRYFNDGDRPRGSAFANSEEIEEYLELQASIAIAKAYSRFHRGERLSLPIRFYAQKVLRGFDEYIARK